MLLQLLDFKRVFHTFEIHRKLQHCRIQESSTLWAPFQLNLWSKVSLEQSRNLTNQLITFWLNLWKGMIFLYRYIFKKSWNWDIMLSTFIIKYQFKSYLIILIGIFFYLVIPGASMHVRIHLLTFLRFFFTEFIHIHFRCRYLND